MLEGRAWEVVAWKMPSGFQVNTIESELAESNSKPMTSYDPEPSHRTGGGEC